MSAAQHEAAAAQEDQMAGRHWAGQETDWSLTGCNRPDSRRGTVCWSRSGADHTALMERHRQLAAEHRAASKALRDAEAQACTGISDADRDLSPFDHTEDITGVSIDRRMTTAKIPTNVEVGATVVFRAVPGMTAEYLQRVVDCHLARNASLGHDVPEMPNCPLVPRGVTARVYSVGNGFAVELRAKDRSSIDEIVRRVQKLSPSPQPQAAR